jgi:Ca2+-binding EF-hand superfamily protein
MKFAPLFLAVFLSACTQPGPVVPKTKVEKQMISLLQKFDLYDTDGNGKLDEKELSQNTTGHPAGEIIDFYDLNKDRKISLREAQKGFSRIEEAEKAADHTH